MCYWINRRIMEYDRCSQLGLEIMEKINERNKHNRTSNPYTKLSAKIRSSMKQFSSDAERLKNNLIKATSSYHITQREIDRRQVMIDQLITKEKQIEEAFKNESGVARSQLLAGGVDSDPWGVKEEPEEFKGIQNTGLRVQQQQIIKEQDKGLDALSEVIARQKNMALDIGNEVDQQNEILDDIIDHTDRSNQRLIKETRHIRIVDRKSATCGIWVVIVLLFVAIIVVAVVPGGKSL
ncbi:syntaxin-8-like isoform X1 [Dreissena polymorpha]|uniref:syntaxin-8-like isoform X1 n=1 Tax=Dreissena polymorpha TaxID=45954 RepID=UPI0022648416|nr:syntaxin-8-like isoform X1 [Dreissena polymorpha]